MKIKLIAAIKTPDRHELEKTLHQKFANKRVDGEWFRLLPDDIQYIRQLARDSRHK